MAKKITLKLTTVANYEPNPDTRLEKNDKDDIQVVVGEAYTVQELFHRHLSRNHPEIERMTFYEDTIDFDMPDISKLRQMDLFERSELFEEIQNRASDALKQVEKLRKEEEEQTRKEASERSVETRSEEAATESDESKTRPAPVST